MIFGKQSNKMQNKDVRSVNKKWTWRKPKGKPKRPLSAYNIFFAEVRKQMLQERNDLPKSADHGIGFRNLAQAVAAKWKSLDQSLKVPYEGKARLAMENYKKEVALWEGSQKLLKDENNYAETSLSLTEAIFCTRKFADSSNNDKVSSIDVMPSSVSCDVSKVTVRSPPKIYDSNSMYNAHITRNQSGTRRLLPVDVSSSMKVLQVASTPLSSLSVNKPPKQPLLDNTMAVVTPNLCSICQSNVLSQETNTFYDDTYEPLPLHATMEYCYNVHSPSVTKSNVLYNLDSNYALQESVAINVASEHTFNYDECVRNMDTLRKLETQTQYIVGDTHCTNNNFSSKHGDDGTTHSLKQTEEYENPDTWNANALEKLLNILETDDMDSLLLRNLP
jgi:HMG (high mobility group) box